jgi:transposase
MARRCRRGRPPHHWKTTTFLAALRHDRIAAPCVFDGAINGERFRAWIEQALAPTLRPGDLVIMDNLGATKSRVFAMRSRPAAPACSTCRPTRPI